MVKNCRTDCRQKHQQFMAFMKGTAKYCNILWFFRQNLSTCLSLTNKQTTTATITKTKCNTKQSSEFRQYNERFIHLNTTHTRNAFYHSGWRTHYIYPVLCWEVHALPLNSPQEEWQPAEYEGAHDDSKSPCSLVFSFHFD